MAYQRQTMKLASTSSDLISLDAPPTEWNQSRNIIWRNGEAIRAPGDGPTLPTDKLGSNGPRALVYMESLGNAYWVYATTTGIYAHDGTNEYDITPAVWTDGGNTVERWSGEVFNGLAVFNSSARDPVYWSGDISKPCAPLPGWPAGGRCNAIRGHKGFLFAIGFTSEGGQRVRWSDAAPLGSVPTEWTPAADNLAGFVDLAPALTDCFDAVTLRDDLYVFKRESIYQLTFIGGSFVFQSRQAFAQRGIAGVNAWAQGVNERVVFIGSDGDVYATDGVEMMSVLDGRAGRQFYSAFVSDPDAAYAGATLVREKTAILTYPSGTGGTVDQALVLDWPSMAVGFRQMPDVWCMHRGRALQDVGDANEWDADPDSWSEDTTEWSNVISGITTDDVVFGGPAGLFLFAGHDVDEFVSGPVEATMEKYGMPIGDPNRSKVVGRLWPKIDGQPGTRVQFRVGGQYTADGPVTWGPTQDYLIGLGHSVDVFTRGNYLALAVESIGGPAWRMGSIDVEFRDAGKW